jgi:peptide chain release factor 1
VPPNEKRGRVHTSTVTVAVLEEDVAADFDLGPVRIETIRGPGSGGQHKNTSDTCVVATHLETGITARCDSRSQDQNKKTAMAVLRARVANRYASVQRADRASRRREQVGTGMRGDKRRTIRVRDGRVHDHVTGRRWNLKRYLEGDWR